MDFQHIKNGFFVFQLIWASVNSTNNRAFQNFEGSLDLREIKEVKKALAPKMDVLRMLFHMYSDRKMPGIWNFEVLLNHDHMTRSIELFVYDTCYRAAWNRCVVISGFECYNCSVSSIFKLTARHDRFFKRDDETPTSSVRLRLTPGIFELRHVWLNEKKTKQSMMRCGVVYTPNRTNQNELIYFFQEFIQKRTLWKTI